MKLTKLERHTAYIIMLAALEKLPTQSAYLCNAIAMELDESENEPKNTDISISDLHELREKMPKGVAGYWFPLTESGKKSRVQLLKQCIEETA